MMNTEHLAQQQPHFLSKKHVFLHFTYNMVLVFQERQLCCNLGPLSLFCHLYNRTLVCIFPQFYVYTSFILPANVFSSLITLPWEQYLIPTVYTISLFFTLCWGLREIQQIMKNCLMGNESHEINQDIACHMLTSTAKNQMCCKY